MKASVMKFSIMLFYEPQMFLRHHETFTKNFHSGNAVGGAQP